MTFPHILIVYRKLIFARVLRTLVSGCKVKEREKALIFNAFALSGRNLNIPLEGVSKCRLWRRRILNDIISATLIRRIEYL